MERTTPVRKPRASTADLLTWSEIPPAEFSAGSAPRPVRNVQPSDGISKVVFGGQVTDEEVESLMKRKPCSSNKMREMTGSGIFVGDGESEPLEAEGASATPNTKRMYQQTVAGMSQISFAEDDNETPRKPTSVPEVAKQRELSGNLDSESEARLKKQLSDAKCKELSGHNIFAPPPEILPREVKRDPEAHIMTFGDEPVMKTSKKIPSQKFAHLSGNDIFKEGNTPSSADKPLSHAKMREISGNDIFADGKAESREYLGGVRKPPGGESSIALV